MGGSLDISAQETDATGASIHVEVDQLDHPCQETNLNTNSPDDPWTRSQLFTVRLWYERVDAGQWEVRMQAKHILTGETRYFREWSPLAAYLVNKLDAPGTKEGST